MKLFDKNNKEETHPLLPSGAWEGFYCYHHDPAQHKMDIELNFKNTVISGSGADDVASFTWKGKYDVERFKIFMTKTYSTHRVYYMGTIDESGIYGTWKLPVESYNFSDKMMAAIEEAFKDQWTGGFHIWPKKQQSESNMNSESQKIASEKLKELYVEISNTVFKYG